MADPTHRPTNGEHGGEHAGWNAQGLVDDARVEVDIGIELALYEIVVFEGNALELHGQIQQRIGLTQLSQHFMAGFANDGGARVKVLIHPMTKAH